MFGLNQFSHQKTPGRVRNIFHSFCSETSASWLLSKPFFALMNPFLGIFFGFSLVQHLTGAGSFWGFMDPVHQNIQKRQRGPEKKNLEDDRSPEKPTEDFDPSE